jgi:hypothetical protein
MKIPLALLILFSIGECLGGALMWTVETDKELTRAYHRRNEEHSGFKAMVCLGNSLRGLSDKKIREVFGEPIVIEGKEITFPKGFTAPSMSRIVFGDTIYQPEKLTTHLYTLNDEFVVACIYWGEDADLKKRARSIEVGFRWDDPFKKTYLKLSMDQLELWELIRTSEFLRALLKAKVPVVAENRDAEDPFRTQIDPEPDPE